MMNTYLYVLSVNGLIFFLSVIFYFFPPKKINSLYGYRTHRSMLNQDIWDFSNKLFTAALLLYSAICFAGALFIAYINPEQMQSWVPMALLVLTLVVCIIKTEQGISKNFDEEGKRK